MSVSCANCNMEFGSELRKPYIGLCGHSICEDCKNQMVSSKCPECNQAEAFEIPTSNYQVLEFIKHFEQIDGLRLQSLDEGNCSECSLHSRNLRVCTTCSVKPGILRYDEKKKDFVLNVENNEDEEVAFQKAKKIAVCGDCALDGIQHEGHNMQSLAILRNGIEERCPITVEDKIKKIQDNANEISQNFNGKFTDTIDSLKRYFEQHGSLATDIEKTIHFNQIEASIQELNDTMSLFSEGQMKLEMLKDKFCVYADMVKHNSKAVRRANTVFLNMDPVLVADRWQSPRAPLLISVFNPKDNMWRALGRMPNLKSDYAVASNKSQIYVVGGMNKGEYLPNVEMYNNETKLRRNCNPVKLKRTQTSAGFHNNKLYVAGGYDSTYMNSVEVFDPDHGDWKDGPPLQRPRADAALVSCSGELYVLGGFNGEEYEEKIEKLSDSMQEFEVIDDMQGSRAGFGACAFRGRIYIAGGWNHSNKTLRSVRSYDPMTKKWRDEPTLNKDRKYFTLHSTSKTIYAIRGYTDNWSLIKEAEKFDPEGQKWDIISCIAPFEVDEIY